MTPEPSMPDDNGQVLPFRPRGARSPRQSMPNPSLDLSKYEGAPEEDDYRHRMLVNVAALAVTILLAVAGAWLAMQIADLRKTQDCVLSGRRNCAQIGPSGSLKP